MAWSGGMAWSGAIDASTAQVASTTAEGVTHATLTYQPADNADPDGATITASRP